MNQKKIERALATKELLIEIHQLTLQLSNLQIGSERKSEQRSASPGEPQSGRSSKRKRYTYEFFKYFVQVHTPHHRFHLETLLATGSLNRENMYSALKHKIEKLYGMINGFRQSEENIQADPA
jgi:hypothetical protein